MSVRASKPFKEQTMVLVVSDETRAVVNLMIPELCPLAIVIVLLANTTAGFELETETVKGVAVGEASVRVAVPVDFPGSVDGLATNVPRGLTFTSIVSVTVDPFALALTVAVIVEETAEVVKENVAVLEPSATLTTKGKETAALLVAKSTSSPPSGAGSDKVMVPVPLVPPTKLSVMLRVVGLMLFGRIVKLASELTPSTMAEM